MDDAFLWRPITEVVMPDAFSSIEEVVVDSRDDAVRRLFCKTPNSVMEFCYNCHITARYTTEQYDAAGQSVRRGSGSCRMVNSVWRAKEVQASGHGIAYAPNGWCDKLAEVHGDCGGARYASLSLGDQPL